MNSYTDNFKSNLENQLTTSESCVSNSVALRLLACNWISNSPAADSCSAFCSAMVALRASSSALLSVAAGAARASSRAA